jgi:NAD(P)H-nitrite reductase large subunit
MNMASTYEDVVFAHTHSKQHSDKLELTDKFTMVVFRTFDDGTKMLNGNEAHTTE